MEQEERIQVYLSGQMSISEEKEFEQELIANDSLKKEFNEYKDVQEAYKNLEFQELKNRFNGIEANRKPLYKKAFYNTYVRIVCASAAVIGLLVVLNLSVSNESYYASYFETYPNVYQPVTRGDKETEATLAFQFYENSQFNDAELEFMKLLDLEKNNNYSFYYAQCLLNNNKTNEALSVLESLKNTEFGYTSEIYWYTALIQLKQKNTSEAKSNLISLLNLNGSFKQKEAKEILESLD